MRKADLVKEILILTGATFIIAAAVFFFMIPSKAAVGCVSGLAVVLSELLPFSVSAITMVLNIGLLIAGFLLCGSEFGYKTVYTSIMLPIFLGALERLLPNYHSLTGDQTLDVLAHILVVSVGLAILFDRNASSGGIDIAAKILNKYTHMELGKAMSLVGFCVALSSGLVYDSKMVVLSVLGTYFNGIILDYFIFSQNGKKRVCIVSQKAAEIRDFILQELHSGATIYEAKGAYRLEPKTEIITIVDRREYQRLMNYMARTDPTAFMTVYSVQDIRYLPKP